MINKTCGIQYDTYIRTLGTCTEACDCCLFLNATSVSMEYGIFIDEILQTAYKAEVGNRKSLLEMSGNSVGVSVRV